MLGAPLVCPLTASSFLSPSGPSSEHFVPPGHGKPSTRKRNARRRLQRRTQAEKAQVSDVQTILVTATSLETPEIEELPTTVVQEPPNPVIGSSLTNSNKRRGFKQLMQGVAPQKTTFVSHDETPQTSTPTKKPYTLIPPSQRTNLPRNIIVTSVDVEEGIWDLGMPNKKPEPKDDRRRSTDDVLDVVLDYSEGGLTVGKEGAFDWVKAEKGFNRYKAAVREDIVEGSILLWKVRRLYLHPAFGLVHFCLSRSSL